MPEAILKKRELRIAHPIHDDNMLEVHLRTEILHVSQFMMTAIQCIRLYYEREFFTDPNITTTDNAMSQVIVGARNSYMLINSMMSTKM